jgi:hypothetical protein
MRKIIKLTESQLERLTQNRINEVTALELADILKNIPCTGESIKSLITKKLKEYGFQKVDIMFLGYDEQNKKILKYIVHTEGPIFTIDTMSNANTEVPCMDVIDVTAFIEA